MIRFIRTAILGVLVAASPIIGLAQAPTNPTPVRLTQFTNLTATTVIDNRSPSTRMNNIHLIQASGTGIWSVQLQYSDSSSTGPWTNFPDPTSSVTSSQSSSTGGAYGYHSYIRLLLTGTVTANYSGTQNLYVPFSVGGGSSSLQVQTNAVANASQVLLNFQTTSFNGLTFTPTNPSGGIEQIVVTGTLGNAGLSNSSISFVVPAWLTMTSPVSLGSSGTLAAAGGQASHQVIGTCNVSTSFAPCALVNGDLPGSGAITFGSTAQALGSTVTNLNGVNIGPTTQGTGSFTTLAASGQFTSSIITGTAPFIVSSTTRVANLNVASAGNADTATNLSAYPTLCSAGQFSQGLSSGSNNCATPAGGGNLSSSGTPALNQIGVFQTATTVAGMAIVNNAVVSTNGSGVPSESTTLPTGLAMGTPASIVLTNATGLPIGGLTGLGTGVGTALGLAVSGTGSICLTTGSTCSTASGLTVGTTAVSGGTNGYVLYNNAGVLGNVAPSGTGNVVFSSGSTISSTTLSGLMNASAGNITLPTGAGAFTNGTNNINIDTTSNNPHIWDGFADTIIARWSNTPTSGNCVKVDVASGRITEQDGGGVCGILGLTQTWTGVNTFGQLKIGNPLEATDATIASAATIAPTTANVIITGTTQITTITAPAGCTTAGTECTIQLLADVATGPFTLGASGNIAVAATPTPGTVLSLVYRPSVTKWYPYSGGGSGNTTSTSLTNNTVPKANGANSIINSLFTDNGTTGSYSGTGGFSVTGGPIATQSGESIPPAASVISGGGGLMSVSDGTCTPGTIPAGVSVMCDNGGLPYWLSQANGNSYIARGPASTTPGHFATWNSLVGSMLADHTITNSDLPGTGIISINSISCTLGSACSPYGGAAVFATSHTVGANDIGKLIIMNCSAACTLTFEASPASTDWWGVESIGSTVATVSLNGKTFNGSASVPVLNSYRDLRVASDGTNYFGDAPFVAGTNMTFTPAPNGFTIASSSVGSIAWQLSGSAVVTSSTFNAIPSSTISLSFTNVGGVATFTPSINSSTVPTFAALQNNPMFAASVNGTCAYTATLPLGAATTYYIGETVTLDADTACNTAATPTLNLNSLGAAGIYQEGYIVGTGGTFASIGLHSPVTLTLGPNNCVLSGTAPGTCVWILQQASLSGVTLQTAGVNNASQTALNFIASTTNSIGLTATPSNPGTSQEKIEIGGSLNLSGMATQAADSVVMNATGSAASPTAVGMPTGGTNGCAGSSNAITYNTTTHAFGCNTISGSGTVNSGTQGQLAWYATSAAAVSGNSNFALNAGGTVLASWDGITTAGLGTPTIGWTSQVSTQSANQNVTLATAPTAGVYEIHYSGYKNGTCTGGITISFTWTDAQSETETTGTLLVSPTYANGIVPIHVSSGNVAFTTSVSSCTYGLDVWMVRAI